MRARRTTKRPMTIRPTASARIAKAPIAVAPMAIRTDGCRGEARCAGLAGRSNAIFSLSLRKAESSVQAPLEHASGHQSLESAHSSGVAADQTATQTPNGSSDR